MSDFQKMIALVYLVLSDKLDSIQETIKDLNDDVVKVWWRWSKRFFWGTIITVPVSILLAIGINWLTHSGIASAIIGVIIFIPLFIGMYWHTPIAAVLGATAGTLEFKLKEIVPGSTKAVVGWAKLATDLLLWLFIVMTGLTIIPFWNNPATLPFIFLASIVLMLISLRWSKSETHRRVVTGIALSFLTINILSCFFPTASQAVRTEAAKVDGNIAVSVRSGSFLKDYVTGPVKRFFEDVRELPGCRIKVIDDNYWEITLLSDQPCLVLKSWKPGQVITMQENTRATIYRDAPVVGMAMITFEKNMPYESNVHKPLSVRHSNHSGGVIYLTSNKKLE